MLVLWAGCHRGPAFRSTDLDTRPRSEHHDGPDRFGPRWGAATTA